MLTKGIVSVIVPAYNVSDYLDTFFTCMMNQTYENIEVIVIDDGSTDNSGEICDKWAKMESRIKVFHKDNGGLSSARNKGIELAQGEWMTFLDPDDTVSFGYIESLLSLTTEDIDQVIGGWESRDQDGNTITSLQSTVSGVISKNEAILWVFHPKYLWPGFAWGKLYRSSIIKENNLRFDESQWLCEDGVFSILFLCNIQGMVSFTTEPLYYYLVDRIGSNTYKSNEKYSEKVLHEFYGYVKMFKMLSEYHINSPKTRLFAKWNVYVMYRRLIRKLDRFKVFAPRAELYETLISIIPTWQLPFFSLILRFKRK